MNNNRERVFFNWLRMDSIRNQLNAKARQCALFQKRMSNELSTKWRKGISFLLAILVLVSVFPVTVFAEDSGLTVTLDGVTGANCSVLTETTVTTTSDAKKPNAVASTIYVATVESVDATLTNSAGVKLTATYTSALASQDFVVLNNGKSNPLSTIETSKPGISVTSNQLYEAGLQKDNFNSDALKYYYIHFDFTKKNGKIFGLLIQVVPTQSIEKAALQEAIAAVPKDEYYTAGDRYNGRSTSTNGFWAEVQNIVSSAESVYNDATASQERVDAAVATLDQNNPDSALSRALANCIPKTQVNPTALYELLQSYGSEYYSNYLNFSTATWPAFEQAKKEAQSLLDSMYADGQPTNENRAENQTKLEQAAAALQNAAEALEPRAYEYQKPNVDEALAGIKLYLELYDAQKLNAGDYTDDSWTTFLNARETAQKILDNSKGYYDGMGRSELETQTDAFLKLRAACHGLVETKESISVRFSVVENYAIRKGGKQPANTVTRTLTLSPGTTIGQAMTEQNISNLNTKSDDEVAVYLNGILCYYVSPSGLNGGMSYSYPTQYQALGLHDGDEVVIARIAPAPYQNVSEVTAYTSLDMVLDQVRHQETATSLTDGTIKVGEPFTVTVTATKAMPAEYDGVYGPVEGASIYIGASSMDKETAEAGQVNIDTLVTTDVNGQAVVTLYEEGWCLLNAFDLSEDGAYTNGGAVLIYVQPASDPAAVKEKLKEELQEAAQNAAYPESYFKPADWTAIQNACAAGVKAIDEAATPAAARTAQMEQLSNILALQSSADEYNVSNLAYFRTLLEQLPDDLSKLDQSSETTIKGLVSRYQDMTEYQLRRLTQLEKETYETVMSRYSAGLPEAKAYQLKVEYDLSGVPEDDRDALQAMIAYLQENTAYEGKNSGGLGGEKMAGLYSFNTTANSASLGGTVFTPITSAYGGTSVTFCVSPEYATHALIRGNRQTYDRNGGKYETGVTENDYVLDGEDWSIQDTSTAERTDTTFKLNASRTYTVHGNEYEMRGISVDGITEDELTSTAYGFFDFSDYLGKSQTNQTFISIADSFLDFTMPYGDVTLTVIWEPVGGTEAEIAAAKDSAKALINSAYQTYQKADYSEENYALITQARDNGIQAVEEAATLDAVTDARKSAIAEMAAVQRLGSSEDENLPDMGATVGRVYISVRNDTYLDGDFTGEILAGWYDLCERDTMMTVALKAIKQEGYAWSGTGGATDLDSQYDISYLGQIYRDANGNGSWDAGEPQLGEFSGAQGSGWMGTLNDWFVNEGLNAFGVANGKLENNDVIAIVYTQNLGVDVGGSWTSSDTSLEALEIQMGGEALTLSPRFAGDILEYALIIPEDRANLTIIPTAANKNYLVKTFLNRYNTDSAFYKRTETVSVVPGNVIYVGVGEPSWPSMNNQETEAITYTATRYVIRVYAEGAAGIQERINNLPDATKLTLSNYTGYATVVKELRDACDALGDQSSVDTAKLMMLEEKIEFLAAIDNTKALIAALPDVETIKQQPAVYKDWVEAAESAYNNLDTLQKVYFNVEEVDRLNAALEAVSSGGTTDEDLLAVQSFNALVNKIGGSVKVTSKGDIQAARDAYDALSDSQKALIAAVPDMYNVLLNAEAALDVVEQIAAIGTVTLESKDAIKEARAAYNGLTEAQQKMVSNLADLTGAEAALKALEAGGQDTSGYREALSDVLGYLAENVTNPIVGSTNGEWAVLAQARGDALGSQAQDSYLTNLRAYVQKRNGKLDTSSKQTLHTEYSRVILALTSLGEDAEHFQVGSTTYDLVKPLLDPGESYAYQVSEQGNNGTIFALIALDSGNYRNDPDGNKARAAWIDLLIDKQQSNGNWPIYNPDQVDTGSGSDLGGVDVCAMAVQALAPYYLDQSRFDALGATHSHAELKSAVDKAVNFLSTAQSSTGGYGSSESSAQVIVALAALGEDAATNSAFTENGISVLADLLSYRQADGGFSHTSDGTTNQMATEQAAYALVAYDRYKSNKNSLYDMTDVFISGGEDPAPETHTVTAEAGPGGRISPSGTFTVDDGADVVFTITPSDGYQIADIQVDGSSVWAGGNAAQASIAAVPDSVLVPEAETTDTCSGDGHTGETVVIGRRAATCTEPGYTGDTICGSCGEVLEKGTETSLAAHQYASGWQSDATGHWHICLVCGEKSAVEPHVFEDVEPATAPETDSGETMPETGGEEAVPGTGGGEETAPGSGDEGTTPEIDEDETSEPDADNTKANVDESEAPSAGNGSPGEESEAEEEQEEQAASETDQKEADNQTGGGEMDSEAGGVQAEPVESSVLSFVGVHPVLLMSVGSGLTPVDAAFSAAEDAVCQVCGYSETTGGTATCDHHGGTATCTTLAVCQDCGLPYGGYAEHSFTGTAYSSGMHWAVCENCGLEDVSSLAPHTWILSEGRSTETVSVYVCPDCGAERTEATATTAAPVLENVLLTSGAQPYTFTLENVDADTTVYVTFAPISATAVIRQEVTREDGIETAKITESAVTEAIQAVTNGDSETGQKATQITIIPEKSAGAVTQVVVDIPKTSVAAIVDQTNVPVKVETDIAEVTIPNAALHVLADKAPAGTSVRIDMQQVSTAGAQNIVDESRSHTTIPAGSTAVDVTLWAGSSQVTENLNHNLTITIPLDNTFRVGQSYQVLIIHSDGTTETKNATCRQGTDGRSVTVSVNRLSTFVVLADTVAESYTITATAGAGGRIEPAGETEVAAGGSQTYRMIPNDGYVVDEVLVDWESVGTVSSYTFRNVGANHGIYVSFRRGVEIPDFGPVIGSVYISVENNTYRGGDFTGTLVSGWYDLCARDTMMTSVLKALALGGYSWWGTGASDTGGYDITYLAGIYIDENGNGRQDSGEPSLAEFDGARGAGWMGTLNDWFVNEGFQSFRANGSGAYELADGDYLNIVYTCNLGEDVGSLWGNTDTSLDALKISGGTLTPRFDGDTLEYTLSITGNSARVTVTPTAVNKNYLVKTFLNSYNRDSAYYKRTESITVKPGDILYIGVGEPSWPSMNNQGSDAVSYSATKYTITVVNSASAEAVMEMIEALPEITYANYRAQASKVSAARAAYDALSASARAKISQTLLEKLEAAEARIEFYEEIDDVKELLRSLPSANRGSSPGSSLIRQVREAAAAYEDLDEEQKTYITSEDAARYEALRLWLIETGAVGANELPIIDGSLALPEQDGIEVVLEPRAAVDSSGNAAASVTTAEFNALLEEAVEAEATLIVIAPTGAERASGISVELPRRALSGVIDETEADLAVRTHLGEAIIPGNTLSNILNKTSGQDLTIHLERSTVSYAESLLGTQADAIGEPLSRASVTEVTITSSGRAVTDFGGRAITLLLPVDEADFRAGQSGDVYQISEDGTVEKLTGICRSQNGGLWAEISTTRLGTFVAVPPLNLPFTDVQEGDWFYDAVAYAYANELFTGTSATTFSPNGTMTRSMLVTVLWRMEGEPTANSANPFADVAAGAWYADAVIWASSTGIVNGTGAAAFDPNGSVTREQIAAILYRYAKTKGWDVNGASSLSTFLDGAQVSDWAARAMEWACGEGLITGKTGGLLDPQGQASRAEVATMLMRLLESRS